MNMWLLAASPALLMAPPNAAPALRTASPIMQFQQPTRFSAPSPIATPSPFAGGIAQTRAPIEPVAVDNHVQVQGGSLRTWSYRSHQVNQVQVSLCTDGRPLDSEIELWHGPDNTPVKMRVYVENGEVRPFSCVLQTPHGPNTIAIRNTGQLEFPLYADVSAESVDMPDQECVRGTSNIQGGALRTYAFPHEVDSVQLLIKTDGRPLNSRIELLQGPNNNKQVIELYTEDGNYRPFYCRLPTPGSGNVVRVVNAAPIEFPMSCSVVRGSVDEKYSPTSPILGGDMTGAVDLASQAPQSRKDQQQLANSAAQSQQQMAAPVPVSRAPPAAAYDVNRAAAEQAAAAAAQQVVNAAAAQQAAAQQAANAAADAAAAQQNYYAQMQAQQQAQFESGAQSREMQANMAESAAREAAAKAAWLAKRANEKAAVEQALAERAVREQQNAEIQAREAMQRAQMDRQVSRKTNRY